MIKAKHYLELHITVAATEHFYLFRSVCEIYSEAKPVKWKVSRFAEDDVDGDTGQWFISARVQHYQTIFPALTEMVDYLKNLGYQVLRAKAEDTLFDTKCGDSLG